MRSIEAIFFDMDGVIVDTGKYWKRLDEEHIIPNAVDYRGDPEKRIEALQVIRGLNVADAYQALNSLNGVDVVVDQKEFQALYDEHVDEVYGEADLMPGYRELVSDIKSTGKPVGLVSASWRDWVEIVLDRFNLHTYFDVVVSTDDIDGKSKPEPDIYLRAADNLGVDPLESVAIEDTPNGMKAAKNAGMRCVAYIGEGNSDLSFDFADALVSDSDELREILIGK